MSWVNQAVTGWDSGPWGWGGLLRWDPVQKQGGTSPCNMLELAQGDGSWSSGANGLPAPPAPIPGDLLLADFGRACPLSVHICDG